MATIRPYQWQVQPGATAQPNLPEDPMINVGRQVAQAGQQLTQTAGQLHRIYQAEKMEDDKVQVREYFNQARNQSREFMAALKAKEGKDGVNAYEEAKVWYKEQQKEWNKTITDPNQKILFGEKFDAMAQQDFDSAMGHQESQKKVWDVQTKTENIAQAKSDAIENRASKSYVDARAVEIEEIVFSLYKHMGDEYAEKKAKQHVSDMYEKVLVALADDDPVKAKQHYLDAKDFINGENQVRIEESIENMELLGQAQLKTDEILAKTDDEREQLALAREEKDPNLRKMVVDMVNARIAEDKKIETIEHQEYMSDMLNRMQAAGGREKAIAVAYSAKEGEDKLSLRRVVDVFYPAADTKIETNYNVLMRAMDEIDAGRRFTRTELLTLAFPYLSNSDRNKLEEYNRTGGVKDKLTMSRVKGVYKTIDPDGAEDSENILKIYEFIEQNIGTEPLNDTTIKNLISMSKLEGEVEESSIWTRGVGADMSYAEAVQKGKGYEWLPDVTSAEEETIGAILRDQGIEVNDLSVRVYKKHTLMKRPYPPPTWRPPLTNAERIKIGRHLNKLGYPTTDNNMRKYKMKFWMGYPVQGGLDAY